MVLAALVGIALQDKSLLAYLPPVDPANGFYDYVRAADILRANKFQFEPDPTIERKVSPVERGRRMAKTYANVLPLLEAGNRKRVWQPRPTITMATLIPEFAYFRQMARLDWHTLPIQGLAGTGILACLRRHPGNGANRDRVQSPPGR